MNGKWLDSFEMPADKARYGAFTTLSDRAEIHVREIIEEILPGLEKAEFARLGGLHRGRPLRWRRVGASALLE